MPAFAVTCMVYSRYTVHLGLRLTYVPNSGNCAHTPSSCTPQAVVFRSSATYVSPWRWAGQGGKQKKALSFSLGSPCVLASRQPRVLRGKKLYLILLTRLGGPRTKTRFGAVPATSVSNDVLFGQHFQRADARSTLLRSSTIDPHTLVTYRAP